MNKDNITNNEQTDEENEEQAVTCQVSDNGIFASENAKHNIHCLNVIGQKRDIISFLPRTRPQSMNTLCLRW